MKQSKPSKPQEKWVIKPLRFTEQDWNVITENMALTGFKMFSRYAKSLLLKRKYGTKKDVMAKQEYMIIGQLSRIGNNINQIARQLNTYDSPMLMSSDRRILSEIKGLLEDNKAVLTQMLKEKV